VKSTCKNFVSFVVVSTLLFAGYGEKKPSGGGMMGMKAPAGEAVVLTGWLTGIDCFLHGMTCDPDHAWKHGETVGFGDSVGHFYFLTNVPRDILVVFFTKEVAVKGTLYKDLLAIQADGLQVKQGPSWELVFGEPFDVKSTSSTGGGSIAPKKAGSEVKGFTGVISGIGCALHKMTCDPDHIWKENEYAGLYTKDGTFIHLVGLPPNFIPAFFTKELYIHGPYYDQFKTLVVHHVEQKGKTIFINPSALGGMKM